MLLKSYKIKDAIIPNYPGIRKRMKKGSEKSLIRSKKIQYVYKETRTASRP
jgi:hypothetical protein